MSASTQWDTIWTEAKSPGVDSAPQDTLCDKSGFGTIAKELCLYIKHSAAEPSFLYKYEDDIVIAEPTLDQVGTVKQALRKRYKTKNLGPVEFAPGWESKA